MMLVAPQFASVANLVVMSGAEVVYRPTLPPFTESEWFWLPLPTKCMPNPPELAHGVDVDVDVGKSHSVRIEPPAGMEAHLWVSLIPPCVDHGGDPLTDGRGWMNFLADDAMGVPTFDPPLFLSRGAVVIEDLLLGGTAGTVWLMSRNGPIDSAPGQFESECQANLYVEYQ